MTAQGTFIVTSSVVEAVEADRTLCALFLRLVWPRAKWSGIGVWKGRVAVEVVACDHLKPVGKGLNRLLLAIVSEASVEEVIA